MKIYVNCVLYPSPKIISLFTTKANPIKLVVQWKAVNVSRLFNFRVMQVAK